MNNKAIFVLIALLVSGCSVYRAYDGPTRSEDSIGVLEVGSVLANDADILSVDGKSRGFGLIGRYELLPGEHELTVYLGSLIYEGDLVVTYFEAEAGKKYTIEAVIDIQMAKGISGYRLKTNDASLTPKYEAILNMLARRRWYVLIRDKETNQIVNYVTSRKKP